MDFVPRTAEELALTFPPDLAHVSASSLGMLVRCEEQWRQRYILGKIQPPALAPMLGTADHAAVGASLTRKMQVGEPLGVKDVCDLFLDEIERRVENVGGLKEIVVDGAETLPAKLKVYDAQRRSGTELVGLYERDVTPALDPVSIEERFEQEVPGLPVVMVGYIDVVVMRPDGEVIVDRKRVGRTESKPKADWSLQAEIYQMVRPAPFEWHLSVTTKEPKIVRSEGLTKSLPPVERTRRLVNQLVAKLGFLYMRFGPDEPWPTTGKLHTWACNYCGYRPECWGWQE